MIDISTQKFLDRLKKRMNEPLPGKEAQIIMAASPQGEINVNLNFNREPVKSSVLILLYRKGDDFYFPLIRRAQYGGIHSGQIGLPGGKSEEIDRDRIDTALRETEEEIGVDSSQIMVIGQLTELSVQASNNEVLPIVGYISGQPGFTPDPAEVSDIIECRLDLIMQKNSIKKKELLVENQYTVQAPYFDIDNQVVWGATAMMLSEFTGILNDIYY